MTPFALARETHSRFPDVPPFEEVLIAHLHAGVVHSSATAFLLARPVDSSFHESDLFDDPFVTFPDPDCWHVYLAAGDMTEFFRVIPHPLPLVSFVRKNNLHLWNFYRLRNSIHDRYHGRQKEIGGGD
jgi:hypothetical protein